MQAYPSRAPTAAAGGSDNFRPDLNVRVNCPDCREQGFLIEQFASGDLICGNCGLVLGDKIVDTRSEWRTFADSEGDDPSRVGGPGDPLLSGAEQLSSVISFRDNHTGVAKSLQRASQAAAKKSGEQTLSNAFAEISEMCDRISLPRTVSDSAKQLFKRQDEENVFRSKAGTTTTKQQAAIVAACIFIACRDQKVGRTFKEIVALSGVPKKEIGQAFQKLSQAFGTSTAASSASSHASSAAGIVARFGNHLGLPPAVQSATTEVVRKIDEFGILAGRSPLSVASACVYFTCHAFGVPKTVKEIGAVVGISESTLRTNYKILYTKKDQLLSEKWFKERAAGSLIADLSRIPVATSAQEANPSAEAPAEA